MATFGCTGIPLNEQETVITLDHTAGTASIYTCDTRYMNKLDKIYERKSVRRNNGKIVALEFEVPANLISFRSKSKKGTCTEEERTRMAERMKERRAKKAQHQF